MVLQLHGLDFSTCTRRVAVVAKELDIPYELVPVDMYNAEHKSDAFVTEKHPLGVVPVAFDDDLRIIESRAICRYLVARYPEKGAKLAPSPSDLQAYLRFEEAISLESGYFNEPAVVLINEVFVKGLRGLGGPDQAQVDECVQRLKTALDGYDRILEKQRYLGGDTLTLADLFHLPYGYDLGRNGFDLMTSYKPNVARWWNEISELESWKAVRNGA
ncbi:hypothetical protein BOTBODRAFT_109850 [Botryobasidium botryosum FD-172 SS1]|uniref:glutathione transferase n=1 Tax=Botryobasidium botryosum (strain FD-172 SS1) TaxID=930990 RepID=A0A067MRW3_BOTB1|nr:hypothetical protein BOTBODRAFT_109850 [Botryobasidium botryosum FD-172 SS1]